MAKQTKGSIEADTANVAVKFQREQHGRGPREVKAQLNGDLLVIRSSGIFTATEEALSTTDEGRQLIKSARRELRQISLAIIEAEISRTVDAQIRTSYYDMNVEAAEQVEVYIFTLDIEKRLLRQDLDDYTAAAPRRAPRA